MTQPVKLIFLLSLMLNLVLAGVMLGQFARREMPVAPDGGDPLGQIVALLPADRQAEFTARAEALRAVNEPIRGEIEAARSAAIGIMTAEQFDEAAYEAETKKLQSGYRGMKKNMAAFVRDAARELDASGRARLAEIMREASWRRGKCNKGNH